MSKSILILTCCNDVHVDAVIEEFKDFGAKAHVLLPERFLQSRTIIDPSKTTVRIGSEDVNIKNISAVWYRKPEPILVDEFQPYLDPQELDFVQAEAQEVLDGVYALLADRFWLTNAPHDRLANRKLLQLAIAREVGFNVPKTLITNDPAQAYAFGEELGWTVAIKALSWASVMSTSEKGVTHYGVYTRRLSEDEARSGLHHVRYAPAMIQEYIAKQADLRVVAVGRELFPVEIQSQNDSFSREDCRFNIRDLPHRLVSIPEIVDPIHAYMARMQIHFACFDFAIASSSKRPVFLEANPNGQWLWLEKMTGAPIAKSIARLLADHARC